MIYCHHLKTFHENIIERYADLIDIKIPDWVLDPFEYTITDNDNIILQRRFIELKKDFELKHAFSKSYIYFWLQLGIQEKYQEIWIFIEIYFPAFPLSYMAEKGFSAVSKLLGCQRKCLQIVEKGDLRLMISNIEPRIEDLVEKHQTHSSH